MRLNAGETRELARKLAELSIALADECDLEAEGHAPDSGETGAWCLKTQLLPGRAHIYLMHDGKLEASGVSYIKEDLPECVAVAQAFSYAAHLVYKTMQRRCSFGSE